MNYLYMLPAAFFAPIIHEWVKARVSYALGDSTPADKGFMTLNPMKFFEPIGFIFMMIYQIGWAQPVPTSAYGYRDKRKGIILTYTLPIIVNLLLGILALSLMRIIPNASIAFRHSVGFFIFMEGSTAALLTAPIGMHLGWLLFHFARINISLAIVNTIIPVYPFAANRLLQLFVSPDVAARMNHYEKPMQIIMMLLLILQILPPFVFAIQMTIINLVA